MPGTGIIYEVCTVCLRVPGVWRGARAQGLGHYYVLFQCCRQGNTKLCLFYVHNTWYVIDVLNSRGAPAGIFAGNECRLQQNGHCLIWWMINVDVRVTMQGVLPTAYAQHDWALTHWALTLVVDGWQRQSCRCSTVSYSQCLAPKGVNLHHCCIYEHCSRMAWMH